MGKGEDGEGQDLKEGAEGVYSLGPIGGEKDDENGEDESHEHADHIDES